MTSAPGIEATCTANDGVMDGETRDKERDIRFEFISFLDPHDVLRTIHEYFWLCPLLGGF